MLQSRLEPCKSSLPCCIHFRWIWALIFSDAALRTASRPESSRSKQIQERYCWSWSATWSGSSAFHAASLQIEWRQLKCLLLCHMGPPEDAVEQARSLAESMFRTKWNTNWITKSKTNPEWNPDENRHQQNAMSQLLHVTTVLGNKQGKDHHKKNLLGAVIQIIQCWSELFWLRMNAQAFEIKLLFQTIFRVSLRSTCTK